MYLCICLLVQKAIPAWYSFIYIYIYIISLHYFFFALATVLPKVYSKLNITSWDEFEFLYWFWTPSSNPATPHHKCSCWARPPSPGYAPHTRIKLSVPVKCGVDNVVSRVYFWLTEVCTHEWCVFVTNKESHKKIRIIFVCMCAYLSNPNCVICCVVPCMHMYIYIYTRDRIYGRQSV